MENLICRLEQIRDEFVRPFISFDLKELDYLILSLKLNLAFEQILEKEVNYIVSRCNPSTKYEN